MRLNPQHVKLTILSKKVYWNLHTTSSTQRRRSKKFEKGKTNCENINYGNNGTKTFTHNVASLPTSILNARNPPYSWISIIENPINQKDYHVSTSQTKLITNWTQSHKVFSDSSENTRGALPPSLKHSHWGK